MLLVSLIGFIVMAASATGARHADKGATRTFGFASVMDHDVYDGNDRKSIHRLNRTRGGSLWLSS